MDAENDNDQPNSSSASASTSSSNNSSSSNLLGHLPMLPFMRSTDDDEHEANETDGNDNVNDSNEEPMPLQPPVTVAMTMATSAQPASASVQQPTMAPITTTRTVTGAGTSTASSSSVGREEPMVGAEQLAVLTSSASSLPSSTPPHPPPPPPPPLPSSSATSSTSYFATASSGHISRLPPSAFLPSANPSQVIFSPFLFDIPALTSPLSPPSHLPVPFSPITSHLFHQERVSTMSEYNNTPPLTSSSPSSSSVALSSSSLHPIPYNLAQSHLSLFHEMQVPIPNSSSFSVSSQQQQASSSTPQTTASITESTTSLVALSLPSSLLQQPSEFAPGQTQQQEQLEQQLTAQVNRYDIADTIDASAVIVQPLEANAEIGHQPHLYPQEAANSEAELEQQQNNIQLDNNDNNDYDVDLNVRNEGALVATSSSAVVEVVTSSAQQQQSSALDTSASGSAGPTTSTLTGQQQQTPQLLTTLPLFNQQQQQQTGESKHLPSFDHHYHNPREFHLHAHPYQHPCVYPYGFRATSPSQHTNNKNINGAQNSTRIITSANITTNNLIFGNSMSADHRLHDSSTSGLCGVGNLNGSAQPIDRIKLLYPNVNEEETPLPRCWSSQDKCLSIGLSQNNLRVHFKGIGKQTNDAASVRTACPIPPACGIYYFEVKIISKGKNGYMGIGLTAQQFRMNRLPGWDKQSYGYHGDDGNSFSSSGHGQAYGPTFTTGDIIGCCVNFVNNTCFYTKNGIDLGVAFRDLPQTKLYPTVGLQTPGEEVDANFGQEPFKFDQIEELMKQLRSDLRTNIRDFPLPAEQGDPTNLLQQMVSSYLVHNGYSETAEAFARQKPGQNLREDISSIRTRQKILKLVMSGKMGQAIEQTTRSYPGLLENNKNLLFMLKCRQFIEMINGSDIENGNEPNNGSSNGSMPTDAIVTITTGTTTTTTSAAATTTTTAISNSTNNSSNNITTTANNLSTAAPNASAATTIINAQNSSDLTVIPTDDNELKTHMAKLVEHCLASIDVPSTISKSNNDNDYLNDVEMENNGHTTNGNISKNGNTNSIDADEEMDVDISPSVRKYSHGIERILEFGKCLSQMGQQLEKEKKMTDEERQMLEDAFSLIAYSNPWASPLGWQLCPTKRETVCRALNSAILESMNYAKWPPLEYCVAHANELLKVMAQASLGACAFVNIADVFPNN